MQVFEPQPFIFQNLCANVALSGLDNVLVWPYACGEEAGEVYFEGPDYAAAGNFGGVSLHELWMPGVLAWEFSLSVVLDDFLGADPIALMKIDVEGFELHVLRGAEKTIDTWRPVLYVENDRPDKSHDLIEWLWKKDYRLWWHLTPLFNPDNFFGDAENRYMSASTCSLNMLLPAPRDGVDPPRGGDQSRSIAIRSSPVSRRRRPETKRRSRCFSAGSTLREAKAFGTPSRRDAHRTHAGRRCGRQAPAYQEARGDAASSWSSRSSGFKADHKLNAYKTAQLGNAFKWTLKDRKYDAAYVDHMTNWLVLKLGPTGR